MTRLGVTREQLAERLGRSLSQADKLRHPSANPQLNTLFALAKALRVSIESLIDGIDTEYEAMKRSALAARQRLTELAPSLNDAQLNVLIQMAEALLRARADSRLTSGTPLLHPDPPTEPERTVPPIPHTAADAGGRAEPEPPRRTPPTAEPRRA
jgi:transcriptional regulator with XRE-family HTH domain